MKVLLVITHGNMGGATNVVADLAKGLKSMGVDVSVAFGEGEYLVGKLKESAIPQFRFKNIERSANPLAALSIIFEIKKLVEKEGFDVVQFNSSNSLPGCLGVKLANKKAKTVFTIHGLSVLDENYGAFFLLKIFYYLFFKFFLSFTDRVVFVSKNNLEVAKNMKLVKDGSVIYNGLSREELHFLKKSDAQKALEEKIKTSLKDKFLLGSIGRLSYQKNYEFLIKVFPEILKVNDRAVCVIIGDGPERPLCEHLIAELNLEEKIFLVGELSDGAKYLKAFDLFVLTSRYEGLPVTLVECGFAGVPTLVSAVGGNDEIVGNENLYPLDDREDFIQKFIALSQGNGTPRDHKDPDRNFVAENMSGEYLKLFQQ